MRDLDTGTDQLLARVEGGVGWLVFNNPERRNALSLAMLRSVPETLAAFAGDPSVRAVVVSGAGDRAFVSGADVVEFSASRSTEAARTEYDAVLDAFWSSWDTFGKPIVAMVRGYCIGGGLLVALKADIRIAAPGSRFAVAAAGIGAGLATGGVEAVLAVVGPACAAELLFSARQVSADEALAIGLVNQVVPEAELATATAELAGAIVEHAPTVLGDERHPVPGLGNDLAVEEGPEVANVQ